MKGSVLSFLQESAVCFYLKANGLLSCISDRKREHRLAFTSFEAFAGLHWRDRGGAPSFFYLEALHILIFIFKGLRNAKG